MGAFSTSAIHACGTLSLLSLQEAASIRCPTDTAQVEMEGMESDHVIHACLFGRLLQSRVADQLR